MKKRMLTAMFVVALTVMPFTACGVAEGTAVDNNVISEMDASDAMEQKEWQSVPNSDVEESNVSQNSVADSDVTQSSATDDNVVESSVTESSKTESDTAEGNTTKEDVVEGNALSMLETLAKDIIMEISEIRMGITASDIEIDRIFYGSFSQEKADEIFVVCKLLKMPHAAGLDRKAGILLDADTLQMVAYKEFASDEVVVESIQTAKGRSLVLFLGTTNSQGWRSQTVCLYEVEGEQWMDTGLNIMEFVPAEKREAWKGNCFYYLFGERIALLYEADRTMLNPNPETSELIAILEWDPDTETFVVEKK